MTLAYQSNFSVTSHANVLIMKRLQFKFDLALFDPMDEVTEEMTELMKCLMVKLNVVDLIFIPGTQKPRTSNCFPLCLDFVKKFYCRPKFSLTRRVRKLGVTLKTNLEQID